MSVFSLVKSVSAGARFASVPVAAAAAQRVMGKAYYHQNVIDHYEKPRNVGSLNKDAPDVGTGLVGAPACGDVMKLQIQVDENNKIIDARFKTFGCGSAIASSSLVTEMVKGKTLDEAMTIKNSEIARELRLPPVKIHCSLLAEDAVKAAIKDIQAKRTKKQKVAVA
eukprot:comp24697_c0_seq1/m.46843 comp24697_c0_seq1/g.46843  ORF comp24697_c0_seq1/g.46843 comp24697_c0_seq1/m.46843 type:complete len:167 (-) comp24697_c0_seq1:281-781(-)